MPVQFDEARTNAKGSRKDTREVETTTVNFKQRTLQFDVLMLNQINETWHSVNHVYISKCRCKSKLSRVTTLFKYKRQKKPISVLPVLDLWVSCFKQLQITHQKLNFIVWVGFDEFRGCSDLSLFKVFVGQDREASKTFKLGVIRCS